MRLLGTHGLTHVHQLFGNTSAYQPCQTLRTTGARKQPELNFGLPKLRQRCDNADVTRHSQFQAAAKCQSIDGCNGRLPQVRNF
jgi:hypothetical protein